MDFYIYTSLKLFDENITGNDIIPKEFALETVLNQTLDLMKSLSEDDGSFFGLITDKDLIIQFSKYNRFMWLIEIPAPEREGSWTAICNPVRLNKIIEDIFEDKNPFLLCDFKFENYE